MRSQPTSGSNTAKFMGNVPLYAILRRARDSYPRLPGESGTAALQYPLNHLSPYYLRARQVEAVDQGGTFPSVLRPAAGPLSLTPEGIKDRYSTCLLTT